MDGHRSKVKRWQVLAMAAAVIAAAALALPAFGSNKDVRIDPDATGGAGYTNLDALTYSAAKSRLDQLSEITLPVDIPGFDVLDVSGVALGSNDASRVLSLSGSASLALDGGTQDVDLLVTAIWPDDMSTTPNIAIAAKTDELSLSKVNRLWDDSYGDVNFATARLAVATEGHEIDPATLPAEAQDFYPEAVDLTGSLDFAGDLELSGRLADAFGYAGYSGEVELEGKLGGSAAALFGRATVDDLGALRLTATLGKSPTAPQWIHDRESIFEFVLDSENNYRPGLSVEEHVTIEVDNTTNEFRGSFSVAPTGAIEGKVGIANIGDFDAPFGLGEIASNLSSIELRLARDNGVTEGGLALGVVVDGTPDPVQVTADFVTDGGTTRANFAIEGDISVPTVVNLAGDVLGTEVVDFPGGDGVELNRVSFSFTTGAGQRTFSVGASATVKQLEADAVLTLRAATGQPAKPLLGLRLRDPGCNNGNGDCIRMSSLLPEGQAGDTLAGLVLPALTLTAAPDSLTELAAADLTRQEEEFFAATYDPLPDTLTFKRGVNLQGRLPVEALGTEVREALGYAEDAVVVLSGTLGAGTTVGGVDGGSASLNELELEAELPPATNSTILPDWVEPTGPTTLAFRYETGIALEFATAATVTIDDNPFQTTISGRLERANGRTSIDFDGTITDWQQPFGVSWIDSLDSATLGLHTSFGGGSATEIEAAVTATTTLDNKPFSLEFGLSKTDSTSASLKASFGGTATLGNIAGLFPELDQADTDVAGNPRLDGLSIGPVTASLTVGSATSAFELTAQTNIGTVTSNLLVVARSGGTFTLGIKAEGTNLAELVGDDDAPDVQVNLPSAALVLGNEPDGFRLKQNLTDGEFDFYKTLYGCPETDERDDCTAFERLEVTRGLKLLADFDLGDDVEDTAGAIGIQTSGSVLLTGTIPVFGGNGFSLSASLGNFRFDEQPDWYRSGSVSLEIGTDGLSFAGSLGVKIMREGDQWMPRCEGGEVFTTEVDGQEVERCYDLLTFTITASVTPGPSVTLTGGLEADDGRWENAFGQDWLTIKALRLQLGVTLASGLPEVTMGFRGAVELGSKDIDASLKVGLSPAPPPVFVRPNLIGFSLASKAGVALSDLVWLNNQLSANDLELDEETMPDVSLRNLYVQYLQPNLPPDPDLCLRPGLHFNADLYVGTLEPGEPGDDNAGACTTVDTNPDTRTSCHEAKDQGCLASVYGSFDRNGLVAGGEINGFDLGPISFDDAEVELALTLSSQRLRLRGGVEIGDGNYVFASGRADLDISRDEFKFSGDAALFGGDLHGYLKASAAFDLQSPSFTVEAWLRADARGAMNSLVGEEAENVRPVIVGIGRVLEVITGNGSIPNVRELPALLERAGATVPQEVRDMANALGTAQDRIRQYGGAALTLEPLLRGFSINVPGTPGISTPRTCITVVRNGTCYFTPPFGLIPGTPGIWVPASCINVVRNGVCYFTPPFGVTVPGICQAVGIAGDSADCSWSGLMRRFVLPALVAAAERATGLDIDADSFEDAITDLVDRFADGVGSIVNIDCAWFSADASRLARGEVDLDVAMKMRLFDHPLEFGASWDFRADGGSPEEVLLGIFQTLFSQPDGSTCPPMPAGHEEVGNDIPHRRIDATLTPSVVDENREVTLSATFDDGPSNHPAVQVDWGDGSTSTIPAGTSATVSASHRYLNDGAPGTSETAYPVTAVVQDAGAHAQQLTATVRNVAPAYSSLAIEPAPSNEHSVVTLRGTFTDPGTADRHEVEVDWGDGSEPERRTVAAGARTYAVEHRYLDDPAEGDAYTVTAVLSDDDRGSATRDTPSDVRNVAPSGISVTPLNVVASEHDAPESGGAVDVTEGAIVNYAIDFEDPGTLDTHTVTVDWGDGDEEQTLEVGAGTRRVELPHRFLDDGTFDVHVTVTDDDGGSGAGTSPVAVRNVAPQVTAALDEGALVEGERVRIEGSISDPGVLDTHTVVIDWGEGRTDDDRYRTIEVDADDRTFAAEKPYGDDGRFTIAPVVTDDDGGEGRADLALTVDNAAPSAAINSEGSVDVPGGRTFVTRAGSPLELRARVRDAGSDDERVTWTWRDGATTATDYPAAPPATDPDPSPQVAPRDFVDAQQHTWAEPCLYEDVAVAVADDDGGAAGDAVDVVVTGTAADVLNPGWWQREYDPTKTPHIAEPTLDCYLRIAGQMSAVFDEARPASTRAQAYTVLNGPAGIGELEKLDRVLLGTWLNFAHGSLSFDTIAATMRAAERVRLDPAATQADLQRAHQEVTALNR